MKYVVVYFLLLIVALLASCIIVFMVLNIIDMWNSIQEDREKYVARKNYEEFMKERNRKNE